MLIYPEPRNFTLTLYYTQHLFFQLPGLEIEGIAHIMDMTENLLGRIRGTKGKSHSHESHAQQAISDGKYSVITFLACVYLP